MKVLILAGYDRSLINFRAPLIRDLCAAGCEVVTAAPPENGDVPARIAALGARFVGVELSRAGLNPLADYATYRRLLALFRSEKPDLLLSYTIKPVIYGSLAASRENVPSVYALITGLGAAFHTSGIRGRAFRFMAVFLYRLALRRCTRVLAQNKDIAELFIRDGIVTEDKISVVPGSGVDTTNFAFSVLPERPPVFLYLGRLLRDKGIAELVAATRLLKASHPEVRVLLVGDIDPNPASFSAAEVAAWQNEGIVAHIGYQADVRPYLRDCTAFVLPSYHEGLPRSVLEAMSTGRPIITTDAMGCRETVFEAAEAAPLSGIKRGINGFLVPVRSVEPLATAMKMLVQDRDMAAAMGRESRTLVERHFTVELINNLMLKAMGLTPGVSS